MKKSSTTSETKGQEQAVTAVTGVEAMAGLESHRDAPPRAMHHEAVSENAAP